MYKNILTELSDRILFITINRPDKLNALNIETIGEIGKAVRAAEHDPAVSGMIITGSGPKAFVAGADISEFADYSVQEAIQLSKHGHDVFNHIEQCIKPVIAAVNGFALGGGCELAMACHLRLASSNAKFGQPEVKLGLIPGYGGTQRLPQLIGKGKATELLMTGGMIDAQQALQLGLVNYVTEPADLLSRCTELMKTINEQAPIAVSEIIRTVNAYYHIGKDGFKEEIDRFADCFATEDFREGASAFLEKRKPVFKRS
jgi:enoyl-CoA hydratase